MQDMAYKPPLPINTRIWYNARLLVPSSEIFTDSFYPDPARGTGSCWVYVAFAAPTEQTSRVLVTKDLSKSSMRCITAQLAAEFFELEIKEGIPVKATQAVMTALNKLVEASNFAPNL